jgi:hypothetical protein
LGEDCVCIAALAVDDVAHVVANEEIRPVAAWIGILGANDVFKAREVVVNAGVRLIAQTASDTQRSLG